MRAPRVGAPVIRVRKIGYAGGSTPVFQLTTPDEYEIVIRMNRLDALDAVYIVADPKRPWLSGFAERRASWFGSFLTAGEIQKMQLTATADVMRGLTGVVIWPHDLEAIEVYAGAPRLPEAYRQHEKAVHCGVVLFWTRIAAHGGKKE